MSRSYAKSLRYGVILAAVAGIWAACGAASGPRLSNSSSMPVAPAASSARQAAVSAEGRDIGARLLSRLQARVITLVNRDRDLPQFRSLAGKGCLCGENGKEVAIAIRLLWLLDRLSARSTKSHPLEILSVYRKPQAARSREPHANGLAVDIAQFQGRRIDSRNPNEALAGVRAVVDSLGAGNYRLGLPKPPATDLVAFAPAPPRPRAWPFFPAPLPLATPLGAPGVPVGIVLPNPARHRATLASRGIAAPWVRKWENERGADLSEVGSQPLRLAIRRAVARGAVVQTLFPDAADHLHVDVAPPAGVGAGPAITLDCCDE